MNISTAGPSFEKSLTCVLTLRDSEQTVSKQGGDLEGVALVTSIRTKLHPGSRFPPGHGMSQDMQGESRH